MKKTMVLMLMLGLLVSLFAPVAEAKKKKKKPPAPVRVERKVEFDYVCPCPGVIQLGSLDIAGNVGGGPIPIGAGEIYFSAVAEDTSGQAVPVDVNQDDGTGANASSGSFCGETEAPILLNEGREIRLFIGDPTICPGPAFGGTISITLSNMP